MSEKSVGIDEEISNFTTSLGTTIGMPGCTCVWPILLAIFYTNAMGIAWTVSDYVMLAVVCLILSLGSAGVPGIGVVSAMAVFKAVNLPIAAIVLLVPINDISDMIRTFDNVTAGNVTAAIVARKMGTLDDNIFNAEEKRRRERIMKLKKSTIVLIVLAVIFLGLSVVSTKYSVTRTITAIDEIGDMKLNDDSIDRFKKAAEYYQALGSEPESGREDHKPEDI